MPPPGVSIPVRSAPNAVVPVGYWDTWAHELSRGMLRMDMYVERLLHLPEVLVLGWIPPDSSAPQPLPFDNHERNLVMLPVFTGADALRRFAEIQRIDRPLVLALPAATAWSVIAALEIDGITINPGGEVALSSDMQQVMELARRAAQIAHRG